MAVLKQTEQKTVIAMLEKIRGNITEQNGTKTRNVSLVRV